MYLIEKLDQMHLILNIIFAYNFLEMGYISSTLSDI